MRAAALLALGAALACSKGSLGELHRCATDADCLAGHVCLAPIDVCGPATCATDPDCPGGLVCDGNKCSSAPAGGAVLDSIAPNPARQGDTVRILFTAAHAPSSCAASAGGQAATCDAPSGRHCVCSLVITSAVPEGSQVVTATANEAGGGVTVTGSLQVDKTAPALAQTKLHIVRHPVGVNDGVRADAGAVVDAGLDYPGKGIAKVSLFVVASGGAAVTQVVPGSDGSFAEVALPGSDAVSAARLAPAAVWISATDQAGNESARLAIADGAEVFPFLVPSVDASKLSIVRHDLSRPDGVVGIAGALVPRRCALYLALLEDPSGVALASAAPNADGSLTEAPVGTAGSSPARVFAAAESKCGTIGLAKEISAGADTTPPVLDGTQLTFFFRPSGTPESVQGAAAAASDTQSAVAAYNVWSAQTGGSLLAGPIAAALDGSFPATQVAAPGLERVWIEAADKAGNLSARAYPRRIDAVLETKDRVRLADFTPSISAYAWQADLAPLDQAPGAALAETDEASAADDQAVAAADAASLTTSALPASATAAAQLTLLHGGMPDATSDKRALVYDSGRQTLQLFVGDGLERYEPDLATGTWLHLAGAYQPGSRTFWAAYDAALAETIVEIPGEGFFSLAPGTWTQLSTAHQPAGYGPLAYDPQRARLVIATANYSTNVNETWEYDGTDWTLTATGEPVPYNLSYAGSGTEMTVFAQGSGVPQTWLLADGTWSQAASAGGEASAYPPLVWDSKRGRVVMLVQSSGTPSLTQVWTFSAGSWAQATTAHAPPGQSGYPGTLAYDEARDRVVFVFAAPSATSLGGWESLFEQWEFDGTDWTQVPTLASPRAAAYSAAVFDNALGGMLVDAYPIYNSQDVVTSALWLWANGWTLLDPATLGPAKTAIAAGYDVARGKLEIYGGQGFPSGALDTKLSEFGSDWTLTDHPPATVMGQPTGAFDLRRGRMVFYEDSTALPSGTLEWDGSTLASAVTAHAPATSSNPTTSYYDARRGVLVVIFSGGTFEYDGTDWSPGISPPFTGTIGGALFDPVRGKGLVHAQSPSGSDGFASHFWEYDGARWSELAVAGNSLHRASPNLIWDPAGNRALLLGGSEVSMGMGSMNDLWALTRDAPRTRTAAHLFRVRLPPGAALASASATWIGAGSGAAGAGAQLSIYDWSSSTWSSLGSNTAAPSDSAAARTISAAPAGVASDFLRFDHLWLTAAAPPSSAAPGATASTLSTDAISVHAIYLLP